MKSLAFLFLVSCAADSNSPLVGPSCEKPVSVFRYVVDCKTATCKNADSVTYDRGSFECEWKCTGYGTPPQPRHVIIFFNQTSQGCFDMLPSEVEDCE